MFIFDLTFWKYALLHLAKDTYIRVVRQTRNVRLIYLKMMIVNRKIRRPSKQKVHRRFPPLSVIMSFMYIRQNDVRLWRNVYLIKQFFFFFLLIKQRVSHLFLRVPRRLYRIEKINKKRCWKLLLPSGNEVSFDAKEARRNKLSVAIFDTL